MPEAQVQAVVLEYPAQQAPTATLPKPAANPGYPAPTSNASAKTTPTLIKIPAAKADTAVVTGILLTPDEKGQPYLGNIILGRAVQAKQPGFPPMISYSDDIKTTAAQDATGRFLFTNIPPGQYALLSSTPITATIILDTKTNTPFLFDVKAGEVKDLGIIPVP